MRSPNGYVEGAWKRVKVSEEKKSRRMMTEWALAEKVSPYRGRGNPCLLKLLNCKHRCSLSWPHFPCFEAERSPYRFHVLDHLEWWREQNGRFVITAHPYDMYEYHELREWCHKHGLDVSAGAPEHSWYFLDTTHLIVVKGRSPAVD
jgi:hypothetical protein